MVRSTPVFRLPIGVAWLVAMLVLVLAAAPAAHAQLGNLSNVGGGHNLSQSEPVTFTADQVEYDRENGLVIASGHVEAWQNDHVLRADHITFDRNTGVAAGQGNVVLLEPSGEVLFADYAEMSQNMKQGVLKDMRALLAENGKLAANGARRTDGALNELSRVVYSPCNLCSSDPSKPPLWQIRAFSAVQDLENKKIEYQDAVMEMYGVPVFYSPFFAHPDPSVQRQSGILAPSFGITSDLGGFFAEPYYWAIDAQSDATITPMMTTRAGPELDLEYRRRFNSGTLQINTSMGYLDGSPQGTIDAKGQFSLNDTWRWGFDVNRASSSNFVRDFHFNTALTGDYNLLNSNLFLEGFGQGAYARVDTQFYQGLNTAIVDSKLPTVLPRFVYSYFGQPDALGGRLSVDTGAFNVIRTDGTNTRRANLTLNWERPFTGQLGDLWKIELHGDAVGYDASSFNSQPNFGTHSQVDTARALPQAAVDFRWPFMRDAGAWGTQLIEPIAQIIVAPQTGDSQISKYPNEDSMDFEFSDANLFGFNRFTGVDRLEGGSRANVALHGAWYIGGTTLDSLIGQSYRTNKDNLFPEASGLHDQVSDVVARTSFTPTDWLDVTARGRFDHQNFTPRMWDVTTSVGAPVLRVTGGYTYTTFDPYTYYDQAPPPPAGNQYYIPRDEITLGTSSTFGAYKVSTFARRDLANNKMVALGADAAYENECFILDVRAYRRYTSINGDGGSTAVLFLITFKTLGQVGYRAY
ncbi:MAG: LPS assembly protein LptD [Acetobacteraceae bacterium]|nr:LPS assembly protein LptD [Acetobacteraceae bacterium]